MMKKDKIGEGFTVKTVQTQTLGEYLLACRKRLGLELATVAKVSQVQPKFLEALEKGDYAVLPSAVYVRGFLRSLALVYRVSAGKLLEAFTAEYEIARNMHLESPGSIRSPFVLPRFIFSPKTLVVAGVSAIGFLSLTYLYFQVSSLRQPPMLEVYSPENDRLADSSLLLVHGKTESGATVYLNNQPIVVDAGGEFRENLSLAPGANLLVIRAVNKFQKETVVTRSIVLAKKEIAGILTPLILELAVSKNTAITLAADGFQQYSGTLLAGTRKTVTAKDKIVLTTGNAGATRVIFNGNDMGVLGKDGERLADIEFTPTP